MLRGRGQAGLVASDGQRGTTKIVVEWRLRHRTGPFRKSWLIFGGWDLVAVTEYVRQGYNQTMGHFVVPEHFFWCFPKLFFDLFRPSGRIASLYLKTSCSFSPIEIPARQPSLLRSID